jgi:mono/diheme cytochrome c family protein
LGSELSLEARQRVERLIQAAELPAAAPIAGLTSMEGLRAGRRVLLNQCVACHDLRTVLVQPRTPATWWRTVQRMGERSELLTPIGELAQWQVTAYLIALSPALQSAAALRRVEVVNEDQGQASASAALGAAVLNRDTERQLINVDEARAAFEFNCSLCHELSTIAAAPPRSTVEVTELIARMVDNGLSAPARDIDAVFQHLLATYANEVQ